MKIVKWPNPILSKKCEPYTESEFGKGLERFSKDLLETMEANNGVGLAAPQVGISKRIFVYSLPQSDYRGAICNPRIWYSEHKSSQLEGCLSLLPNIMVPVERSERIIIFGKKTNGERISLTVKGTLSIIFQHETDHLNGLMFFDRLSNLKRKIVLEDYFNQIKGNNESTT
jgi:peptide deformylase